MITHVAIHSSGKTGKCYIFPGQRRHFWDIWVGRYSGVSLWVSGITSQYKIHTSRHANLAIPILELLYIASFARVFGANVVTPQALRSWYNWCQVQPQEVRDVGFRSPWSSPVCLPKVVWTFHWDSQWKDHTLGCSPNIVPKNASWVVQYSCTLPKELPSHYE